MIKKMFKKISVALRELVFFSFPVGFLEFLFIAFNAETKLGRKIEKKKHLFVVKKLEKKYSKVISDLNELIDSDNTQIEENKNVFIFWYQGIENAPLIVQECIKSIKKAYYDYNIIFLDKNNIKKYSNIPEYIYEKLASNKITITHFSDILRLNLLLNHGGIWIDSTCFCTDVPDYKNLTFFTIAHNIGIDWNICMGKLSVFYLASGKNNYLIKWVYFFIIKYWEKENVLPCYFFIDCVFFLACKSNLKNRTLMERVPKNNENVFLLDNLLRQEDIKIESYKDALRENNTFKLSYKRKYSRSISDLKELMEESKNE